MAFSIFIAFSPCHRGRIFVFANSVAPFSSALLCHDDADRRMPEGSVIDSHHGIEALPNAIAEGARGAFTGR